MDLDRIYNEIELLRQSCKVTDESLDEFYTFIVWQVINADSDSVVRSNPALTINAAGHVYATWIMDNGIYGCEFCGNEIKTSVVRDECTCD